MAVRRSSARGFSLTPYFSNVKTFTQVFENQMKALAVIFFRLGKLTATTETHGPKLMLLLCLFTLVVGQELEAVCQLTVKLFAKGPEANTKPILIETDICI